MTTKEKSEELVNKHLNINLSQVRDLVDGIRIRLAKENALRTVDEIINEIQYPFIAGQEHPRTSYWLEVKEEIKKL